MQAVRDSWVELSCVRPLGRAIELEFGVKAGRGGRLAGKWRVNCSTVREWRVSDASGGGIRLYPPTHPAARQYARVWTQLSFAPGGRLLELLGAVVEAHVDAVDDWIPSDRYVSFARPRKRTVVWRGPDFLMRAYAQAIRRLGVAVHLVRPPRAGFGPSPCKVLHFGNSFVVAAEFTATREETGLPNKAMKLTRRGRRRGEAW